MNKATLKLDGFKRIYPGKLKLSVFGYLPDSSPPLESVVHPTLNFGFILSGKTDTNEHLVDGIRYSVNLPALCIHIPGKAYENLKAGTYESFYFSYQKDVISIFQSAGYDLDPPFREINITKRLNAMIRDCYELSMNIHDFGNVDRMDRLAEAIILETLLSPQKQSLCENEKKVRKVASHIEIHFKETIDLDKLLHAHGIAPRTFLRYWKLIQNLSPNKYINHLRINEAKYLLETTRGQVVDIAEQVGFKDPYYFSRAFKQQVGVSPLQYRKKYL